MARQIVWSANAQRQCLPALRDQVEKKGRTKEELHTVIHWLTGYDEKALATVIANKTDFETFFAKAPRMHPNVGMIIGMIPQSGTVPAAIGSKRSRTPSCGRCDTWTSWWMSLQRSGSWIGS